jgi:aminopeptidase N
MPPFQNTHPPQCRRYLVSVVCSVLAILSPSRSQPVQIPINHDKAFVEGELHRRTALMNAMQEPTAEPNINITYYKLDLAVSSAVRFVSGSVTIKAQSVISGLTSITLDLRNSMHVDSIKTPNTNLSFSQLATSLVITLDRGYSDGEPVTMQIFYAGSPTSTGFGSYAFSSHQGYPWIYTLSEPYGARDWWPCKDHPLDKADSVDIWVTVDTSLKVGSNGILRAVVENGDGTHTYRWEERYPISTYLIFMAIANYAEFTGWWRYADTDSMPVLNYVLPEHLAGAQTNLPKSIDMLSFFSNLYGLYPFVKEKYGHADFGWGGGMEHQTMTCLGNYDETLMAHELAHQWFGDMITCGNWANIWMNEGFATYSACLYHEQKLGPSFFASYMNGIMTSAKSTTASLYVQDTSNVSTLFSSSLVYNKGATVLHMLRHVLGDSTFFHALRAYAGDPRFRFNNATTEDFRQVCEAQSGKDLGYFFNEWVYGKGYPQYTYSWGAVPDTDGGYIIPIRITQTAGSNPAFFTMPLDIKVQGQGWDTTVVVYNNLADQFFSIHTARIPSIVALDPNNWVLKSLSYASVDENTTASPPQELRLEQNYPNPFNPVTSIEYTIGVVSGQSPVASSVKLAVYDLLGREVAVLVDGEEAPGSYEVKWDASALASGVYVYRLSTRGFTQSRRMLLVR